MGGRGRTASPFGWPKRTRTAEQQSAHLTHAAYGTVQIDVWTGLHVSGAPDAPFSVIRVQVERLPNTKLPPRPLWLAWIGGPLPTDLSTVWR